MAGLLDFLQSGPSQGGLLDLLRRSAMQQQMPSGLASDQAQYDAPPQQQQPVIQSAPLPPPSQPQQAAASTQSPSAGFGGDIVSSLRQLGGNGAGVGDRLAAGFQSWANTERGNLVGGLANGLSGLMTGQRADAAGIKANAGNVTAKALVAKGIDPQIAMAATQSPDLMKTLISQTFGPQSVQPLGNGYIWDAKQGKAVRAYEPESKKTFTSYKDATGKEVPGVWDPAGNDGQGTFTPIKTPDQPVDADPAAGLSGDDYLKTLPAGEAALVKKIANYEINPASLSNRGGHRERLMMAAARFDPTFDQVNYGSRVSTRKDFTSGKSAQNLTAFNTALGHLDTFDRSIDKLGNSDYKIWNSATMGAAENTNPKYAAALKEFRTAKTAVIDELTRAFRGTGGNVHDLEQWEAAISDADSPTALHAAVRQAVELLHSRIESVGDQYRRGMGKTTDSLDLLSPKAKSTLQRLSGSGPASAMSSSPTTINGYKIEQVD